MTTMDISDISDACFGEREEHYRKQSGMYDLPIEMRQGSADHAYRMASSEMLDEIHCMLRELLKNREHHGL